MTFANSHSRTLKTYSHPDLKPGQMAVLYDGTADVYDVDADERDAFVAWVLATWSDMYPNSEEQFEREIAYLSASCTVIDFGA
jgi:hypothetical protein